MKVKKVISMLLAIALIFSIVPGGSIIVNAATAENITYTIYNGYATVTGYSGWCGGSLEIPSELGGYPVKSIGENAFKDKSYLTEVTIPEGVTGIGSYAFAGTGLEQVVLPESLTTIGSYAFYQSDLEEIHFGSNISYIRDSAFHGCTSIQDVYIEDITSWAEIDFASMYTNPLYYADNLYLNNTLTTEVVLEEGITSIGRFAFANFQGLTGITIPKTVTRIGDSAFRECINLNKLNITDVESWCGVYFGGSNSSYANPMYYAKNLYLNNELVTDLVIPEGVTEIKNDVFRNCKSITSITLPSTLTKIGGNTFVGCSAVNQTNISDITAWCNIDFTFSSSNPTYLSKNLYLNGEPIVNLVIPAEVTEIKPYAFYNCDTLESVTVLGTLDKIGEQAFAGCDNLASIDLGIGCGDIDSTAFSSTKLYNDETNWDNGVLYLNNVLVKAKTTLAGDYVVKDGTTAISGSAFKNCTSVTSISMPDTVKTIGEEAFYGCSALKTIELSDNLETLGAKAFYTCSNLTSVSIPNGVKVIDTQTFYECSSLTEVSLGTNVEFIGASAFYWCTQLKSINIPTSVKQIGNSAFYLCKSIDGLVELPNIESIGSSAFYYCSSIDNFILSDKLSSISGSAFMYCEGMKTMEIPDSVSSIGSNAFYGSGLSEVVFGTGIKTIGTDAFKECDSVSKMTIKDIGKWCEIEFSNVYSNLMYLEKPVYIGDVQLTGDLIIPEGVEYINPYSFMYCDEFSAVILSDTVKEIKTNAFTSCSNIKKIIFGENVTTVSSKAFYNCGNISTVAFNEKLSSIGSEAFYMSIIMNVWYEGEDKSAISINSTNTNAFNYATWHNNIDIVDGHVYQYVCSAKCAICNAVRSVSNHSYDNDCDTVCDVCGNQRIANHSYSEINDHTCDQCRYSKTPAAPVVETYTDTMVTLVANEQFEYSKDGVVWQDENIFLNLSPYTQYYFYQRVKATDDNDCSGTSAGKYLRTNKSTQNKPSSPIVLSTSENQIVLAYINGYEYSIDGWTWQDSNLFENLDMNKQYTVYQRVAADDTHYASPRSDGIKVWTDSYEGDINRDNVIDNLDRLAITRYLAGWSDYSAVNMKAADVDGNGYVDNLDRLIITRHLANWEGYEELYDLAS